VWEFAFEDLLIHGLLVEHGDVSLAQKWEFIGSATVSAAIAGIIFNWVGLQILAARKRAEERMRESKEQLFGLIDIATDAIISIDTNGIIRLFNQGAKAIFGHNAEDIIGEPLDLLLPERFRGGHGHHLQHFLQSPEASRLMNGRGAIHGLRKDGSEFPAEASISKLDLPTGTVLTVMLRDITERQRVEDALLAAKEEAELSNRAKSEFLAGMSHELRTPLNAIIGFSEVMNKESLGPVGSPRYREYAGDIHASGKHLLALINDILDISKIEAHKVELDEEEVELAGIVRSCLTMIKERAHAGGIALIADGITNCRWWRSIAYGAGL